MIVYDLECRSQGHRFEGWFKSSDDFARQKERGLVSCPFCGTSNVDKAVQAARLARKGNQLPQAQPTRKSGQAPEAPSAPTRSAPANTSAPANAGVPVAPVASHELPEQALALLDRLARMQTEALQSSRYVGGSFAEDARAMHYGEREVEAIHGETTLQDAQELMDEGISVIPLPFPIASPDETN